jgi:outer membrane immunogenic protein
MTRLLLGTIAAIGLMSMSAAQAADMPLKAPPRVAAPAPFSWSGFYIGAHVGGAWGTVESEIPFDNGGVFPVSSHTINGFVAGGQVGWNWQVNPWLVFGVEGQFSWTDLKGSTPCIVVFKCTTEVNWVGTLAGRVGYTFDRTMLYVKAGVAWADSDYLIDLSLFPGVFSATASETRTGLMLGAGVEYAFLPNWSAKLEYNYMDFDTDNLGFAANLNIGRCNEESSVAQVCRGTVNADVTQKIHLVKFGVNYRFNWGAPIAARY